MTDRARLEQALIAADKAGDVEAARALARALRGLSQPATPESPPSALGSDLENAAAGWGKSVADLYRGARQFSTELGNAVGFGMLSPTNFGNEEVQRLRQAQDEAAARDAALMGTKAGIAGNILGGVATAAPLAMVPGANTALGAGLTGAGLGATAPVGTGGDRGLNTALGFAGGVAGQKIGEKATQFARNAMTRARPSQAAAALNVGPSQSAAQASVSGNLNVRMTGGGPSFGTVGDDASAGLTTAQKRALESGKLIGMKATPGQATGSKALQQLEAKMESQPWSSGPFNAIKAGNQKRINQEWAKLIGENSDVLDSTVLAKADDRLGKVFQSVRDDRVRTVDPAQFVQKMRDVSDEFEAIGGAVWGHPLVKRFTAIAEKGAAKGKDLGSLSSKLGREASKQMTSASGDRDLGMALYQIKDYVDDLVSQGLGADDLERYSDARKQYRNLMLLTQRVGTVDPSSGNVNALSLANLLQQKDRRGFLLNANQTPAYESLRFAQAFKPIVGDSGTATRSAFTSIPDIAIGLPINLATRAYTSSPAISAALAAQAAGQQTGRVTAPFLIGTAPYLPVVGGLLGANAAR